jgi:hypothetical protein
MEPKFRYRVESRGYYIPQFYNQQEEKWEDFTVKLVYGQLANIAHYLSTYTDQWAFKPSRGQKEEDRIVFFENEIKVCAFLGAAKYFYTENAKEFQP